tara:strand:+ start:14531 stop:14824 length:294 start_codon:yes stop_codon:yes gene_type:complete
MTIGNIQGYLETGFVDFTGETIQTVTLQTASNAGRINIMVYENQPLGASANTETDIPTRNLGNIQISAHLVTNSTNQFNISTSAEFYGRVIWFVMAE